MSDRQIKLYSEQSTGGTKQLTTTISNVNPAATGANMRTYAQMLNRFTTNTYKKTDLVETYNLDTETIKLQSEMTLNSSTGVISGNNIKLDVTGASGVTFGYATLRNTSPAQQYLVDNLIGEGIVIKNTTATGTYEVYIGTTETNKYYSKAISGTVTVS